MSIFTKYSSDDKKTSQYLFVFGDVEDPAIDHAPVMSWESSVENLKQLQTEPIEKDKESEEECCCVTVMEQDGNIEIDIKKIEKLLNELALDEPAGFLRRFLAHKSSIDFYKAIQLTKESDPVSSYQLKKIAEKFKK